MSSDLESIDDQDFSEDIPKSEGSVVMHLISQLRPGMSLARITLPTFILEQKSTIQRLTDWMVHADMLRTIQDEEDPCIRCLTLATWIISGFHMGPRTPKKPYNSILGEVFRSVVLNQDGTIGGIYQAEQVSHHPPISAFYYSDRKGNSVIWGHSEMRSKFYGNSIAALMDHENTIVNYECTKIGESYVFNFPDMYGKGVLFGKMVMEIQGEVRIKCEKTGVTAKIYFHEKPFWRGKYNCVSGTIFQNDNKVISIDGRWSAFVRATDHRNNKSWLTFDVRKNIPLQMVTPPIEEQCDYESQYVWQNVSKYLQLGDTKHATEHKLAIENKQRLERTYFEENKKKWQMQLFHYDKKQKRYVPNELNLTPYVEGEEAQKMPHPMHTPVNIKQAQDAGVVKTMAEVQKEAQDIIDSETN